MAPRPNPVQESQPIFPFSRQQGRSQNSISSSWKIIGNSYLGAHRVLLKSSGSCGCLCSTRQSWAVLSRIVWLIKPKIVTLLSGPLPIPVLNVRSWKAHVSVYGCACTSRRSAKMSGINTKTISSTILMFSSQVLSSRTGQADVTLGDGMFSYSSTSVLVSCKVVLSSDEILFEKQRRVFLSTTP